MKHHAILFFLISVIIYQWLISTSKFKITQQNYHAYNDSVTYYKNKLDTQTASIKTLLLTKKDLQNTILKKDKESNLLIKKFKSLHQFIKHNTITVIDSVRINYTDTVPYQFSKKGTLANKWLKLKYEASQMGIKIDSLTIPNETFIVTGTKQKWFLGPRILTTEITNKNPYIKTTNLTSAEITIPDRWYKKWYIWLAAGLVSGYLTSK